MPDEVVQPDLTEAQKRDNAIRFAFGGRADRFDTFCRAVREIVPDGTTAILRGSADTGHRCNDHAPFDDDGAGTERSRSDAR